MNDPTDKRIELRIYRENEIALSTTVDRPLQVGRQRASESPAIGRSAGEIVDRVIVAPISNCKISREHLLVVPNDDFSVRLTNISRTRFIALEGDIELPPGAQIVTGDICLKLDDVQIHIRVPNWAEARFFSVDSTGNPHTKTELDFQPSRPSPTQRLERILDDQSKFTLIDCLSSISSFVASTANTSTNSRESALSSLSAIAGISFAAVYEETEVGIQMIENHGAVSTTAKHWQDSEFGLRLCSQNGTLVENPIDDSNVPPRLGRRFFDPQRGTARILYAERNGGEIPKITLFEAVLIDLLVDLICRQDSEDAHAQTPSKNFRDLLSGLLQGFGSADRRDRKPPSN